MSLRIRISFHHSQPIQYAYIKLPNHLLNCLPLVWKPSKACWLEMIIGLRKEIIFPDAETSYQ